MYILRPMNLEDIDQVVEVDKLSFPSPWSPRSYAFEITDNGSSHMISLESIAPDETRQIVGYSGMWLIEGEAHISTIATHPAQRGKGLGELLLAGMLGYGMQHGAEYSVLEVRVSNTPAIRLYEKYEYQIVGQRKNYYRDNNEDAFLMQVSPLDDLYRTRLKDRLMHLRTRLVFIDLLSQSHQAD